MLRGGSDAFPGERLSPLSHTALIKPAVFVIFPYSKVTASHIPSSCDFFFCSLQRFTEGQSGGDVFMQLSAVQGAKLSAAGH